MSSQKQVQNPSVPSQQNPSSQSIPFTFNRVSLQNLPAQKRLGRTSKFLKLFEALKTLPNSDMLQFSIEKYTTIQGLRKKLSDMGFTITTRSNTITNNGVSTQTITAYVYKTPPETTKA